MARTLETVSRPNSRSIAARSSRNSSKTSLAVVVAGELKMSFFRPALILNRFSSATLLRSFCFLIPQIPLQADC
jgi:hypothetical protein